MRDQFYSCILKIHYVYYFYFSYYYLVLNFASMSRQCINHTNCFCYICGEFTPKSQLHNMTPLVKKGYEKYFGCMIGDQNKSWPPHLLAPVVQCV